MIDLSHLTEEEQGVIMTVLRRDAELKKAEEERIRKLEKLLSGGSQADIKRKYLTGEWFYEAKSRRHLDKIHGSEIILASMKQKKAALEGSLRIERSKTPNSRSSDISPPPKPARCLEAPQPQEINSDTEKENLNSVVHSPRTPRHNPFNRASLIVVEPPENKNDVPTSQDQESSETEPISPLRSHPTGEAGQTSGGSITSEGSSVGFRPVPKKRTFLSRCSSSQRESNGQGLDAQGGSAGVVPAPRRSLRQRPSGGSAQAYPKGQDEMPEKSATPNHVSQSEPPSKSVDENSQQPLSDVSQVLSSSSLERERNPPSSLTRDRLTTNTRTDASTDRQIPQRSDEDDGDQTQQDHAALSGVILHTGSIQDSHRGNNSSAGTAMRQEELSLPQSTVEPDPPVCYDLNFIDMSEQQTQKTNQKHIFKLSTQTTSPTGDEDSIAKVLDWFSRSTDSSDWLNSRDGPETKKSSDKHAETRKLRGDESLRKEGGDIISDRNKETLEMKRSHIQRQSSEPKELRATDRTGNKELSETQDEVKKITRERMRSPEVEDNKNESQPPQISHLKSFWEKSNMGPKILISKSITPSNKGPKPTHPSAEKDEENVNKPHRVPDMPSVQGIYNGKECHDKYTSNVGNEGQQLVIGPQENSVHISHNQDVDHLLSDPTYNSHYAKFAANPEVADRTGSDTEVLGVTTLGPQLRTSIQSRQTPECENAPLPKPNPQPDSIFQTEETLQQVDLPKTIPASQLDTDPQARDSPESENPNLSRNSPYKDHKQGANDHQITSRIQICRSSSEDMKKGESEDNKTTQPSMSPKRKEDMLNKERSNSPHSNRQGLPHQECTAERIKQLKSFWEQEKNKPFFYTGKPKGLAEGKTTRGVNQAKLNKRFTKSEYDLRSIGNDSQSDEEDSDRHHPNFTVFPLNQRIDKMSPGLGTSRAQFNTLRDFWDEATSDTKGSFSLDKPKSPKRKEPLSAQLSSPELKCGDTEFYRASAAFEKTRPAVIKSSPSPQNRSKLPHDRQTGSRAANDSKTNQSSYQAAELSKQGESKRSSKDSNREEKPTKPQSSSGKEPRSPKNKKDSFNSSSSRGNSMRRATSMFALSAPDEKGQSQLRMDASPVHSQSRKQRQNSDKGAATRRAPEEIESPTLRARAYVPRDYRHYLGMTEKTSVHASLAPAVKDEGSEAKCGYEFDLSGPVRASTPVSSEERYGRRGCKLNQRPLRSNYSSSDTGQESPVSSPSESRSSLRNSSNRENDDEERNPVRKALRRAEARPKNLAKSMEDITAALSPRQERRQDTTADMRRISDDSTISSPSSSLFSDPEHLKKMSKSVPSFLQKEDADRDTDSNCEDSYHRGRLTMGNSLTNLTSSSGMASVSSEVAFSTPPVLRSRQEIWHRAVDGVSSRLSGSVTTMYSGDFGNVEVQGNIQFSINYIQRLREFHIFVGECRDLAAVDPKRGRSDPYVKSYLVPDKANLGKRKTSVKKKTLNPTFNEILRYRVRMEYLRTQTLILSVWHHDTFGRNSFLGEVDVDLSKWDFDHTQMNNLALKARATPTLAPSNGRGEMKLAVRFLPQITHSEGLAKEGQNTGEVHIWVKECKNLPLIRATLDPYVKCFVLPDTSRKSRQKTRVLRRTVDPVFNHTMVYDGIRESDLAEACVELTVWDRDRLASNLLGGLRLGPGTGRSYGAVVDWMDSTPYEVSLWERMKAAPNEWVEDILPLRMLNSAKTAFK